MLNKLEIAKDWLPRYTGMPLNKFGENILLTNFSDYVENFSDRFKADVYGEKKPMQACTNSNGLTIINFGIGSPNAATIMDLLTACQPNGVLFLGKCGGLKDSSEIGNFVLPIAAIRGEGTSDNYFPSEVPALPSFKLHKFVSEKILEKGYDYRTGVIHTPNRRVWEHDKPFLKHLKKTTCIGIDMETATIENSTIIPPCHIDENAFIKNSVIGPYVSVGEKTNLKDCVIKNSIIQKIIQSYGRIQTVAERVKPERIW